MTDPPILHTYSDMLKVLSKLVWTSYDFPLCNPLLQVFNISVELEEFDHLVETITSLLGKILETGVELVNLGLSDGYLVAVMARRERFD